MSSGTGPSLEYISFEMGPEDLTPVRIRGKKRKYQNVHQSPRSGPTPDQPAASTSTQSQESSKPAKIPRYNSSTNDIHTDHLPRSYRPATLSSLELLPTELLEPIFFYSFYSSGSISLLTASPHIRSKIDSAPLRRKLCDLVFRSFRYVAGPNRLGFHTYWTGASYTRCGLDACTDDVGAPGGEAIREPDGTRLELGRRELAKTRSALLRCRWFTPELFLNMRERLLRRERARLQEVCMSASRYTRSLEYWLSETTFIPRKMLAWPITDTKKLALDKLSQAGCKVDWEGSLDGETADKTLLRAIEEKRWDLLVLFMGMAIDATPTAHELRPALVAIDWHPVAVKLIMAMVKMRKPILLEEYRKKLWTKARARARQTNQMDRDMLDMNIWFMAQDVGVYDGLRKARGDITTGSPVKY